MVPGCIPRVLATMFSHFVAVKASLYDGACCSDMGESRNLWMVQMFFFTQVLRFGQSIRVEMCPEQLKHFAEHVQFNWRASGSAADSLFPQTSWFLTHWGSIHSPLFPKRVSDE